MIKDILKDLRELRDEMVQSNWFYNQRLSNIILKYDMKLQEENIDNSLQIIFDVLQDELEY